MKKRIAITLAFLLIHSQLWAAGTCWNGGKAGTTPYTVLDKAAGDGGVPSAAVEDISYCVNTAAAPGETVSVTKTGAVTWTAGQQLIITQGVNLIGPGAANLTIKGNYDGVNDDRVTYTDSYLISYVPTVPANRDPFRLSEFAFDMDGRCGGILLSNGTANTVDTTPNRIRIDHNIIGNCSVTWIGITVDSMWGVIDHNNISGCYNTPKFYGNQDASWNGLGEYVYGTANNMYFEDNIVDIPDGAGGHSAGHGSRYAVRYNTYTYASTTLNLSPWFDAHGNQPSGIYSSMGIEIYGNMATGSGVRSMILAAHRGGRGIIFGNKHTGFNTTTAYVQEDYDDYISATTNTQPQHVDDSYYWNNRRDTTLVPFTVLGPEAGGCCNVTGEQSPCVIACSDAGTPGNGGGYYLNNNDEYHQQNVSYNGTTEIGLYCGATLPGACTVGDGAWIPTNIIFTPCDSIGADNVGAGATKPLLGTLYKCTAPDTWTPYYTPYQYPHPLTLVGRSSPGVVTGGSVTQ